MTTEEALERWPSLPAEYRQKAEQKWAEAGLEPGSKDYERRRKLSIQYYDRSQETVVDPETGEERQLVGGAQPGSGRPRKKRVAQRLTEWAQQDVNAKKLLTAVEKGLTSTDERVAAQTAERYFRIEAKESEMQLKEDEFDRKPEDELRAGLALVLARLEQSGALDLKELMGQKSVPEAHVEGTVAEDGDGGAESEQQQQSAA